MKLAQVKRSHGGWSFRVALFSRHTHGALNQRVCTLVVSKDCASGQQHNVQMYIQGMANQGQLSQSEPIISVLSYLHRDPMPLKCDQ